MKHYQTKGYYNRRKTLLLWRPFRSRPENKLRTASEEESKRFYQSPPLPPSSMSYSQDNLNINSNRSRVS